MIPTCSKLKKSEGRGKICHAIPVMRKQAGAAQKWAHTMCRLGRARGKEGHYGERDESRKKKFKRLCSSDTALTEEQAEQAALDSFQTS